MKDKPIAVSLPDASQRARLRRRRRVGDLLARTGVSLAGLAVIASLALIIIYLVMQTLPVFRPASASLVQQFVSPVKDAVWFYRSDAAAGHEVLALGASDLYRVDVSRERQVEQLPMADGQGRIIRMAASPSGDWLLALLADNSLALMRHTSGVEAKASLRLLPDSLLLPLEGAPVQHLALSGDARQLTVAVLTSDQRLLISRIQVQGLPGEEVLTSLSDPMTVRLDPDIQADFFQLSPDATYLLVGERRGRVHLLDLRNPQAVPLSPPVHTDSDLTALQILSGNLSVITGDQEGRLVQWFVGPDAAGQLNLLPARSFRPASGAVLTIAAEPGRRGFQVVDAAGFLSIYYVTSGSALLRKKLPLAGEKAQLLISADQQQTLVVGDEVQVLEVNNPHPDLTFAALWKKQLYEGQSEAGYSWQAAASLDNDETKVSLVPLLAGTLKAALFALLFAVPLAVMAAIYTACFMQPRLRELIKPAIEMMEALPTVIIGFIAGIWFAPFLEKHLMVFFVVLAFLPLGCLITGFALSLLPGRLRERLSRGHEALLLILPVLLLLALAFLLSPALEAVFFQGDLRLWLSEKGIDYHQRNAMVIGIAMGFAIIPTIFTLSEDALFNVPRHLYQSSMALGATAWQTLYYVILPTASAGIIPAIMLGFGRAIGETMIILMAASNSQILNFKMFEGLRGLTSTLAVELPEAASGSSHFRVLFLAALILLIMTFVLNSLAEWIRQRIRNQYKQL